MPVLVRIDAYDPVAAAPVTLRAASEDDDRICHLDGTAWWPAITELPKLRYDLFDGDFSGRIQTPASSMRLSIEPWPLFGRYALADARIRIWTGDAGASFVSWALRFDGRVTAQPRIAAGVAELPFAVDDSWLDAPLLSTYAGTGGAEGPEALKGSPKPLAIGAPRYVAGVLVDPVKLIWQVSAYGPVQGFEDALDGLARFGTPAADHASFAALEAATIAPGTWATCKNEGLARFGAPPNGQISFMLSGDAAGGWSREPGQIIRRIAQIAGGTGKIEDASLDALDLARPWNLSVAIGSQITARELIQRIAASVNAVAGMSWTGRLFAVPIGINASQMTLAADGSMMPQVREVEQIAVGAPWWRLTTQAERTWEVHAPAAVQYSEPAEPGATKGAPAGTDVAGRSASQVVADLDQNALNMLAEQTLASTWRVERDQLIFMADGTPVRTVTEQLGIETDDIQLFVTEVKEVNPVSGESKFLLAANADGVITGIYGLSGSSGLSELGFMASRFLFVDDSGLNPTNALVYEGGVWKLKTIEVDTLKAGSVITESIAVGGVVTDSANFTASDVTITSASETTVIETPWFDVGDGSYGRALAGVTFLQDGTSNFDTSMRVRAYVDTGAGYVLIRDRIHGIDVDEGNARFSLPVSFTLRIASADQARVKITAQSSQLPGERGTLFSSVARDIGVDIFRGQR